MILVLGMSKKLLEYQRKSHVEIFKKLAYIHYNPLAEHRQLVKDPGDYKYSSAWYYEINEKKFSFLKDLREEF